MSIKTEPEKCQQTLAGYLDFWCDLGPEKIAAARPFLANNFRFRDPFQDISGIEAFETMLIRMYKNTKNPRFVLKDVAWSTRAAYILWDFTAEAPVIGAFAMEGMSEIHFDEMGKITAHLDHADPTPGLYGRVPILGGLIQSIRRNIAG
jgi:steroid Delta-isomerase